MTVASQRTLWQHKRPFLGTIGDGSVDVADDGSCDLHPVLLFDVLLNGGPTDTGAITSICDTFLMIRR